MGWVWRRCRVGESLSCVFLSELKRLMSAWFCGAIDKSEV